MKEILRERDWAKKLAGLRRNQHPQAQFLWATFRDVFHYCAVNLQTIADNARDLDLAVRWGFGWDTGPFEIWQAAGWQQVAEWIAHDIQTGKAMSDMPLPAWVTDPVRTGVHGMQWLLCAAEAKRYQPRSTLPVYQRQLFPDRLLGEARAIRRDRVRERRHPHVAHGDGIAILSFKQQDAHDQQRSAGRHPARDRRGRGAFQGAGHLADRAAVLGRREPGAAMQGVQEPAPDGGLFGRLKGATQRVKYTIAGGGGLGDIVNAATGNVPHVADVVAEIPAGLAAPEIRAGADHRRGGRPGARRRLRIRDPLHAHRRRRWKATSAWSKSASACCPRAAAARRWRCAPRMMQRASPATTASTCSRYLRKYFQQIAMGEVAKSAELAREMGYLKASDRIVLNRFELLHVAKEEARALIATAYRPPLHPRQIPVAGRTGIATLKAAMVNMLEGGFISEHDYNIGCRIAETMCGGIMNINAGILSVSYLLASTMCLVYGRRETLLLDCLLCSVSLLNKWACA